MVLWPEVVIQYWACVKFRQVRGIRTRKVLATLDIFLILSQSRQNFPPRKVEHTKVTLYHPPLYSTYWNPRRQANSFPFNPLHARLALRYPTTSAEASLFHDIDAAYASLRSALLDRLSLRVVPHSNPWIVCRCAIRWVLTLAKVDKCVKFLSEFPSFDCGYHSSGRDSKYRTLTHEKESE